MCSRSNSGLPRAGNERRTGRTVTNKLFYKKRVKIYNLYRVKILTFCGWGEYYFREKWSSNAFAGKVTVEEIYTVDGDVNLKTGNITFWEL